MRIRKHGECCCYPTPRPAYSHSNFVYFLVPCAMEWYSILCAEPPTIHLLAIKTTNMRYIHVGQSSLATPLLKSPCQVTLGCVKLLVKVKCQTVYITVYTYNKTLRSYFIVIFVLQREPWETIKLYDSTSDSLLGTISKLWCFPTP